MKVDEPMLPFVEDGFLRTQIFENIDRDDNDNFLRLR